MKAILNGITVEGTPQEIVEYQRLNEVKVSVKTQPTTDTEWFRQIEKITSNKKGRCPNEGMACYCTGACDGRSPALTSLNS